MYVHRILENELEKQINRKEILAVYGPRQSGKTTLIKKILENKENVNFLTFDDVETLELFEKDTKSFITQEVEPYNIIFIDEIQYSNDSGKKLKFIYDTTGKKIIVSGSSAIDISIKSLKYLVGRVLIFRLGTFNFEEFLSYKDPKVLKLYRQGTYKESIIAKLNKYLDEFLQYGGYPEVVLSQDKVLILKNLLNIYLLREIKEILEIKDNYKIKNLLEILASQNGGLVNYAELSQTIDTYSEDLKQKLEILEKSLTIRKVRPFFTNKKTEVKKNPKIYFSDTGFRNTILNSYSLANGCLFENFVLSEFDKKEISLNYWRTKSKAEVDFVFNSKEPVPIEVKSILKSKKTTKSFLSFIDKYKPSKAFILSRSFEDEEIRGETKIYYVPLVKLNKVIEMLT